MTLLTELFRLLARVSWIGPIEGQLPQVQRRVAAAPGHRRHHHLTLQPGQFFATVAGIRIVKGDGDLEA